MNSVIFNLIIIVVVLLVADFSDSTAQRRPKTVERPPCYKLSIPYRSEGRQISISFLLPKRMPGTFNCGTANIENTHFQSKFSNLDSCCVEHDSCGKTWLMPGQVIVSRSKKFLVNDKPFNITISMCKCDKSLRDCFDKSYEKSGIFEKLLISLSHFIFDRTVSNNCMDDHEYRKENQFGIFPVEYLKVVDCPPNRVNYTNNSKELVSIEYHKL